MFLVFSSCLKFLVDKILMFEMTPCWNTLGRQRFERALNFMVEVLYISKSEILMSKKKIALRRVLKFLIAGFESGSCPSSVGCLLLVIEAVRQRGSLWQSRALGGRGCQRVGLLVSESGSWWQTLSAFYPDWTVEIARAISWATCTVRARNSLTCPL